MCAYRVKAGESKGAGWAAAAILAATLLGLILVGFAGPGRASEGVVNPVYFDNHCPVGVWEGNTFGVELRSNSVSSRIVFYLEFEPGTAGASDYVARNGMYNTTNPGRLTFGTAQDDLAEGEESFQIRVVSHPSQLDSNGGYRCEVTVTDDDMMQVGASYLPALGPSQLSAVLVTAT